MIEALPQQGRWRLLSRVCSLDDGHAVCEADFLPEPGHFPDDPIVPGVLLLEALSQVLLLLSHRCGFSGDARLAAIDRARFLAPVVPPATVRLTVTLRARQQGLLQGDGVAECDGVPVCTARITGSA